MKRVDNKQSGLILLVVLSMLTLFSMLAISYVVFSSQSRSANFGMARRDFYRTDPPKLMDAAVRQLLRGTSDTNSVMWRQGLLGDLYGNTDGLLLSARTTLRDVPSRTVSAGWFPLPIPTGSLEAPKLLSRSFLKIPLDWVSELPEQDDVLNGRLVTFLEGPLRNETFRIVRYIGEIPVQSGSPPQNTSNEARSLQYSVTIDLTPLLDKRVSVGLVTRSLQEWIDSSSNGAELCYGTVGNVLAAPFPMLLNGAPMNSMGHGMMDGRWLDTTNQPFVQTAMASPRIHALRNFPAPNDAFPGGATGVYGRIATAILQNYSYAKATNSGFEPTGDGDEPYDAADFANFHLGFEFDGASSSADIIPSFHRPSVINFIYSAIIADRGSLASFTLGDLFATIELLQRASGRPLSFQIRNVPNPNGGAPISIEQHPDFSGNNDGFLGRDLELDWNAWSNSAAEQAKFENWVRWLQAGPWDVDNDGDGINDSNWVDINLSLMTSPEGKLLKTLAAYQVEDLGGRLNLNTSSNFEQSVPTYNTIFADARFGYGFSNPPGATRNQLPQGLGFGTAEISLRHLFPSDLHFQRFIAERYGASRLTTQANFSDFQPGIDAVDDAASRLKQRHRLALQNPLRLPGLPVSVFGKTSLSVDLFGNPIWLDNSQRNQIVNDPYEARFVSQSHHDNPINLGEWERLERIRDWDRSSLPQRLERLLAPNNPTDAINRIRSLTPLSSSTSGPAFSGTYRYTRNPPAGPVVNRRVGSFIELVEMLAQQRHPGLATFPYFSQEMLNQLFPIEFKHNLPLDLNRPFGNGLDDDGDGLIDEADEVGAGQLAEYANGVVSGFLENYAPTGSLGLDPFYEDASRTPFETQNYNGNQGRQLLARHLYCLAQLLLPDEYIFPNQADPSTPYGLGSEERARILAQWAVNVVDHRDADFAMTRFPYDPDPFPASGPKWTPTVNSIVWGLESPDLLLTESLALHDLRISKRVRTVAGGNREFVDDDWQQVRVPEGSLYLELFCPKSPDVLSSSISDAMASNYWVNGRLNLSAFTPADNQSPPSRHPVWRVLLLEPQPIGTSPSDQYNTPAQRGALQYQFNPGTPSHGLSWGINPSDGSELPNPVVNRVVWFTGTNVQATANNIAAPTGSTLSPYHVFHYRHNTANDPLTLGRGQYLVAGPREETYIGMQQPRDLRSPPIVNPPERLPSAADSYPAGFLRSSQNILLRNTSATNLRGDAVQISTFNGQQATSPNSLTVILQSQEQVEESGVRWPTYPRRSGLNISEPLPNAYYREPTANINPTANGPFPAFPEVDGYINREMDAFVDSTVDPQDAEMGRPIADFWETEPTEIRPKFGTRLNWSTAVLQRVADPDRPWHAQLNPYITVDWLPIDLTVFSGETYGTGSTISAITAPDVLDSNDPNTLENDTLVTPPDDPITLNDDESQRTFRFNSRQKSGLPVLPTQPVDPTWNINNIPTDGGRTFYSLHSEISPRNEPLTTAANRPSVPTNFEFEISIQPLNGTNRITPSRQHNGRWTSLGDLNSRFGLRGVDGGFAHASYPRSPVFRDADNLPQPPAAPFHPNRDFVNAGELLNVPLSSAAQLMQDFTPVAPSTPTEFAFNHVLDFEMHSSVYSAAVRKSAGALLELVGTRDPWIDSETMLNPLQVANSATPNAAIRDQVMAIYLPPFNRLPNYVEPGRVNLNSVASTDTLRGVMWNLVVPANDRNTPTATVPYLGPFETSRRSNIQNFSASSALGSPNPRLDRTKPSQFAGVFKSAFATDAYPIQTLRAMNAVDTGTARFTGPSTGRLFSPDPNAPHTTSLFNYPISRLTNLVSDNSNVYAVRVTLGFFEYDPRTGIGQEYGQDEGKVSRSRAFYIIDRSVPVGYLPGEDVNADRCILLKRIIE